MNPAKCRGLLFSMLSVGLFVCLRLRGLTSVDNPYLLLLFTNSVRLRGVHTATEDGDSEMLAFAIYLLLTHTVQTTEFPLSSHLLVPSAIMHIYHTHFSLVPSHGSTAR